MESQTNKILLILLAALILLLLYLNGFFGQLGDKIVEQVPWLNQTINPWINKINDSSVNNTARMPLCSDGGLKVVSIAVEKNRTIFKLASLNTEYAIGSTYGPQSISGDEIHTTAFGLKNFNITFYVPNDLDGEASMYVKAGTEDGLSGETKFYTAGGIPLGGCSIRDQTTGGVWGLWGECTAELNASLLLPGVNNTLTVSNNIVPDIFGLSFMDYDYMEFRCASDSNK